MRKKRNCFIKLLALLCAWNCFFDLLQDINENRKMTDFASAISKEASAEENLSAVTTEGALETTGSAAVSTGSALETTGSAAVSTGSALETTGSAVDTTGSALETTGSAVNTTGSALETTGSAVGITDIVPDAGFNPESIEGMRPEKISAVYTCSYGESKVKITWEQSKYADWYVVYRKENGSSYRKLIKTTKCDYVDNKLKKDKNYVYKIIPIRKENDNFYEGKGIEKRFSNKKIVSTNHQKYSYAEFSKDLSSLVEKYHGLVTFQSIGKSEDGRNIYDVVIGNPEAKKTMLVVSALHGREYMTSLLSMNQIEYYLSRYHKKIAGRKVEKVLDNIAIHYIPMANPDGVTISQFGIGHIRKAELRKKLYRINKGDISLWKANARGVDLNKNYPYKFQKKGSAGRGGYTGTAASSEGETRAIIALVKSLKKKGLTGVVNYHAMGSIVFGDCRPKAGIKKKTERMYHLARKITGYSSAASYSSSTGGNGEGNLREYIMYVQKLPSITLEIGTTPCPVAIREFPSIWARNKNLVFQEAELLS